MTRSYVMGGLLLAATWALVSCRAVSPPPENMSINYSAESGRLGYVVGLSFFTKAQMKDPLWEFARLQRATMNWCQSESRYRRRDVRWVKTTGGGHQKCAIVVYTVECLVPRNVPDRVDPRFADHLEQSRTEMLSGSIANPPEPGCGRKDRWAGPKKQFAL